MTRPKTTRSGAVAIPDARACEHRLAQRIAEELGRQWLTENRDAIAASNDYVERHSVPLASFRQF
ncbi:MAG TPA: type II toxin-antitoxin system CcdA family antitoxin [Stellaceae bacterium]